MINQPPVLLTRKLIDRLQLIGINTLHPADRVRLPYNTLLEPPNSLKWLRAEHSFEFGAFSYAVSGYFFACKIGRYCSFGEDVQVGRHSHPLDFISTSPVFYLPSSDVLGVTEHFSLTHETKKPTRPPTAVKFTEIGSDVYIGHGAFVLPGVIIGNGAVVAARSVVTKNVLPYSIVAGSPAKVVRHRFEPSLVSELLETSWWEYSPAQLAGLDPANPQEYIRRVHDLKSKCSMRYKPGVVALGKFANEDK